VLPEWINRNLAAKTFASGGDYPLDFVSQSRGSLQGAEGHRRAPKCQATGLFAIAAAASHKDQRAKGDYQTSANDADYRGIHGRFSFLALLIG
jgi:hypothetical protein